jgi:hypothetical protein
MNYSQAFCLAANRTKQTKLVHIVREVAPELYCVFMTSQPSALYA